jgi:hypothetical protein
LDHDDGRKLHHRWLILVTRLLSVDLDPLGTYAASRDFQEGWLHERQIRILLSPREYFRDLV